MPTHQTTTTRKNQAPLLSTKIPRKKNQHKSKNNDHSHDVASKSSKRSLHSTSRSIFSPTLPFFTFKSAQSTTTHQPTTFLPISTRSRRTLFGFGKKKQEEEQQQVVVGQEEEEIYPSFLPAVQPSKNPLKRIVNRMREQVKSETDQLGIMIGRDEEGNRFFEYREPWMSQAAPPRRRVEFASGISTTTVHELWDSWLRHARKLPPSKDEFMKYNARREIYLERVRQVELQDAQLRQQEQLQMKLQGYSSQPKQDPASAQASVMDILKKMEEQLTLQRAKQAEMKLLHSTQAGLEDGPTDPPPGLPTESSFFPPLNTITTDTKNNNAV